ncbi:MAG: uroporphyrinogen decarboxylase family protein [Clostridiaceae bacterium]|nr:uroporphyrinogen decarboxylase family protein [Clostridiaceae bacterium]
MNMTKWFTDMIEAPAKKALPILSFPSITLMGITVRDLIADSERQAEGMALVAARTNAAASVSMMDLSVEAECFGATVRVSEAEVPTVTGSVVSTPEEADALHIPEVGAGRTGRYIDALRRAKEKITDRPVFAGVIGPFSLAGRLMDVTQAMVNCYDEPEMVHTVLEKAAEFIIRYSNAYKATGANGIVMAEPLAGLLSPSLAQEFSADYVRRIVDAVRTEDFAVIYHNCGNTTIQTIDSILSVGASAYHFGDAIDLREMLPLIPSDIVVMGNISPVHDFRGGTPESIAADTTKLLEDCSRYPNFVISSGCDIPPMSPWANIDAFFAAVDAFYRK